MINERLARFYDIPDVRGDLFRRVKVPEGVRRGGIVTQASILTTTSNGTRTSPVKRGTWILKTLLGIDPGLPVANVGEIAPKVPGIDKATVRQRLEIHRSLPQCARCHSKIDPLGFALENYNAAGEWRSQEASGFKGWIRPDDPRIDSSSVMPDGTKIEGLAGLQQALPGKRGLVPVLPGVETNDIRVRSRTGVGRSADCEGGRRRHEKESLHLAFTREVDRHQQAIWHEVEDG